MTRILVAGIDSHTGDIVVTGDNAHYLTTVVRVRAGEPVGIFDGRGGEWRARVVAADRRQVVLGGLESAPALPEPPVAVTLAIGLLKGDQMDAVVRDATALGVARIVPLSSEHVAVPSRAWRAGGPIERWTRLAVAAAAQCGRAVVPEVAPITPVLELLGASDGMALACIEPRISSALPLDWSEGPCPARAAVYIGPEGGWSDAEHAAFADAGARRLDLGPRTLRAELAPAVALSVLWSVWDWTR